MPRADLTYSHATVNGFTETGPDDRLLLGAYDAERLCAQFGGSLVWTTKVAGHFLSVEINSGIEQMLIDHKSDQQASLVTAPSVSFNQSFTSADLTSPSDGLPLGFGVSPVTSIYAGYDGRVCGDSSANASLGLRVCF